MWFEVSLCVWWCKQLGLKICSLSFHFLFFFFCLHIHNNCLLLPKLFQRALTDNYALVLYIYKDIYIYVGVGFRILHSRLHFVSGVQLSKIAKLQDAINCFLICVFCASHFIYSSVWFCFCSENCGCT